MAAGRSLASILIKASRISPFGVTTACTSLVAEVMSAAYKVLGAITEKSMLEFG